MNQTAAPHRAPLRRMTLTLFLAASSAGTLFAFPLQYDHFGGGLYNNHPAQVLGKTTGFNRPLLFSGETGAVRLGSNASNRIPSVAGETFSTSCMADVNGDGNDDIVAVLRVDGTAWNDRIMATFWGGPGGFTAGPRPAFTYANNTLTPSGQLFPADLDRDGDLDLVLVEGWGSAAQSLSYFINAGLNSGNFSVQTSILTGQSATMSLTDVAVLNANADDWPDLMVADRKGDKIHVFLNSAGTGFTAGTSITEDGVTRLLASDVDRDGRLDIVSASGSEDDPAPRRLVWRKFQGLSFASPAFLDTQAAALTFYGGMTFGDITDDGTPDLIFARTQRINASANSWYY